MKIIVLVSAVLLALGHGDVQKTAPIAAARDGYAYAVDFSAPATAKSLHCLKESGYSTVFVRVYSPHEQGQFDSNSVSTIRLAASANLSVEVYMTPQPRSTKNGTTQFMELYTGLTNAQIRVSTVWVQVVAPVYWDTTYKQNNINFLNEILTTAQRYGIRVGFYTNHYDWMPITNGAWVEGSPLWYWNVRGGGPRAETRADFSDFVPFAKWSSAAVKQFAQVEIVCDMVVNRDVYVVNRMTKAVSESSDPNVLVLGSNFGAGPLTGLLRTD